MYWPVAQNVGTWLGIKYKIYIYPHFLWCRENGDQQFQDIFIPWLLHFATSACAEYMEPKFNQTHNAAMFSSKWRNICFAGTWHLVLLDFLFVLMQVKPGTFLAIHRCAFSFLFNLK